MNIDENSTSTQDGKVFAIGRIHRLKHKLGERGPFGHKLKANAVELDCAKMHEHSPLFMSADDFKRDLEIAVAHCVMMAEFVNQSIETGEKKRVTLQMAINALNDCSRFLQEANILAEVLMIKALERHFMFNRPDESIDQVGSAYVTAITGTDLISMDKDEVQAAYEVSEIAGRLARQNMRRIHKWNAWQKS